MINLVSWEVIDAMGTEDHKLCNICENSFLQYSFSCGRYVCGACLKEFMLEQLKTFRKRYLSKEIIFTCPAPCKCPIPTQEYVALMDRETMLSYRDTQAKMFIMKQNDVMPCPNSTCSNIGFYNKNCCDNFSCSVCNYTWKNNLTMESQIEEFISKLSFKYILSVIKIFILAKKCNNCQTTIERNEGCKHMECFRCDYSFCFKCICNWKEHNEFACMGLYTDAYDESLRPEFDALGIFWLLAILILKILFSFTIIFRVLWMVIKLLFSCSIIALNSLCFYQSIKFFFRCTKKDILKGTLFLLLDGTLQFILFLFEYTPYYINVYKWTDSISFCLTIIITLIINLVNKFKVKKQQKKIAIPGFNYDDYDGNYEN